MSSARRNTNSQTVLILRKARSLVQEPRFDEIMESAERIQTRDCNKRSKLNLQLNRRVNCAQQGKVCLFSGVCTVFLHYVGHAQLISSKDLDLLCDTKEAEINLAPKR